MLRSSSLLYYVAILVVSFVCGVALFHFIEFNQAKIVMEKVEPRLLRAGTVNMWQVALPVVIVVVIMFLLATHSFLKYLVRVVAAIRITFFGFGSVFLLQELSSIWVYASWWFPFQLIYSLLFLVMAEVLVPTVLKKQKVRSFPMRPFIFICILFSIVIGLEYFVLSSALV